MALNQQEFIRRMNLFEQSGLTVAEFCKQNNISPSRFYRYRQNRRTSSKSESHAKPQFENILLAYESSPPSPAEIVISFPNAIRCEMKVNSVSEQLNLLKELANL